MGDNTGLRHDFIDSNNVVNGQKYYYAVVSYDHGDVELKVPPAECSKTITVNPETNEIILDVNTIAIVPEAPAAGYVVSTILEPGVKQIQGRGTGEIVVDIIDAIHITDAGRHVGYHRHKYVFVFSSILVSAARLQLHMEETVDNGQARQVGRPATQTERELYSE